MGRLQIKIYKNMIDVDGLSFFYDPINNEVFYNEWIKTKIGWYSPSITIGMVNMKKITFEDFNIRYDNLRKHYPNIQKCCSKGCKNPVDVTPGLGPDTSCAYHRLLFDWWLYEVRDGEVPENKAVRRSLFSRWCNKIGISECDRLVLIMAQDGINWAC
jgi:hypothetical protein